MEQERRSLRDAVAGMEQVLGVVGHELRTPLAGLRAMTEFMMAPHARGTADAEYFLGSIHGEIVRMTDTVNNLLEAARLNSGRARWKFVPLRVGEICRTALDAVRPLLRAHVQLSYDVEAGDIAMVGDPDALRRLILNLVTNSQKHTQSGRIHVGIHRRDDGRGRWAILKVSDTGSGIPPEILRRLGEPFALNSGAVGCNHVNGTGLGFGICKAIASADGGEIQVETKLKQGTTITVILRADLSEPQYLPAQAA